MQTTRGLVDLRLRAFHVIAMKKAQQLTVISRDPHCLVPVCLEKFTKALELGVRPERDRSGSHNLFGGSVGFRFDLFCADLTQ